MRAHRRPETRRPLGLMGVIRGPKIANPGAQRRWRSTTAVAQSHLRGVLCGQLPGLTLKLPLRLDESLQVK